MRYSDIFREIRNFREFSNRDGSYFDQPGLWFFKIFFYFDDENGLLGIKDMWNDDVQMDVVMRDFVGTARKFRGIEDPSQGATNLHENTFCNTAHRFLRNNDETLRANQLRDFVSILSQINSESPWYFNEISGLDGALEKKYFGKDFKIEEERPQIHIKCLPESIDSRIGTMLDLYKSACFSHKNKKEIVPVNLRKFNMGICLFRRPMYLMDTLYDTKYAYESYFAADPKGVRKWGKRPDLDNMLTDAKIYPPKGQKDDLLADIKYFELRGCEIDINTTKSVYATINNGEGVAYEYTIDIAFDDIFESRQNAFIAGQIGDILATDIVIIDPFVDRYTNHEEALRAAIAKQPHLASKTMEEELQERENAKIQQSAVSLLKRVMDRDDIDPTNMVNNAINQGVAMGKSYVNSTAKKLVFGNIGGTSLLRLRDNVNSLLDGNIGSMISQTQHAIASNQNREPQDIKGRKLPGWVERVQQQNASVNAQASRSLR